MTANLISLLRRQDIVAISMDRRDNFRTASFQRFGVHRMAAFYYRRGRELLHCKRQHVLFLFRRFNRFLAIIGLLAYYVIGIKYGLERHYRFAVLYRDNASAAKRFFRSLNLYYAAGAKCKGAQIGHEAGANIRRINFRRSLAVNGKSCINQGRHEGIAHLDFSGQRHDREANFPFRFAFNRDFGMFNIGAHDALRRAEIRMRCITQRYFAS